MPLRRAVLAIAFLLTCAASGAEIVPGVHLVRGLHIPGSQPDGNSVVLVAPQGLIVVDTGRHEQHTAMVLALARELAKPVAAVVNTHWHLDHIGGNARVRDAFPDVKIYATGALADARTGFLANYRKQLEEMIAKAPDAPGAAALRAEVGLIDAGPRLMPDVVVGGSGTRTLAGRDLLVNVEKNAVTAADLWIHDPSNGLVIAGDLVTLPAPFLDTACAPNWQRALDRIARTDFDLLIPGHGAPLTRRQFEVYRSAFASLVSCSLSDAPKGECGNAWMTATAPLAIGRDEQFTRAMMDYYVDLLRADGGKRAKSCGE